MKRFWYYNNTMIKNQSRTILPIRAFSPLKGFSSKKPPGEFIQIRFLSRMNNSKSESSELVFLPKSGRFAIYSEIGCNESDSVFLNITPPSERVCSGNTTSRLLFTPRRSIFSDFLFYFSRYSNNLCLSDKEGMY